MQVPTGASVNRKNLKEGETPRITVTNVNNGISGYFDCTQNDTNYRTYNNFISVSFLGTVFYHNDFASLDMKVHCLKPKDVVLNYYTGEFLVSVIRKSLTNWNYSDQISSTVLPDLKIKLPVDSTGSPDFPYMESYMKNLEATVSASLTKLRSAEQSQNSKISISKWKPFPISKLFNVVKGTRLTKADMKDGTIRFIGASATNNGITAYIDNSEHLHPQNTITVNYNGSIGEAFYQDEKFWASDDVNVLYPLFDMNRKIAMFIIPAIKMASHKYAFIDKWKKEYMENDKIYLPANSTGSPDFSYMELYMESVERKSDSAIQALQTI